MTSKEDREGEFKMRTTQQHLPISQQYQDYTIEQLDGLVNDGVCEYEADTLRHEIFIFKDGSTIEFFYKI